MEEQIIGVCVFRNDGDGCLSSKYINQIMPIPFGETCKRIPAFPNNQGDPFVGDFRTTWLETDDRVQITSNEGTLNITILDGAYRLEWRDMQNILVYSGIGMM